MPVVPALGPEQRARAWAELAKEPVEVLVVGAGVTGSGVALDAATRGLRTALVEARDFASGTSSRSSKLFHGGLRYLEQFDFTLVREALHERDLSVTRVRVRDVETGREVDVQAEVVVNATGVWTDDIQTLVGGRGRFHVRASKGVHIVVPRDRINGEVGLILRTEKSVLFVIPWGSHWIVGTTDTDWSLDKAHPAASKADIDYILEHVNQVLSVPITHADITGVYAGLRPLLSGEQESTSQLSREHAVARPVPGVIAVAGGKYTTYRPMAADAVDAVAEDVSRRVPGSVTENVPLVGAEGYAAMVNQLHGLSERWGIPHFRAEHLLNRYGSETL